MGSPVRIALIALYFPTMSANLHIEAIIPLCSSHTGHDSEIEFRKSNPCIFSKHDDITEHRKFESTTESNSVDTRNDWFHGLGKWSTDSLKHILLDIILIAVAAEHKLFDIGTSAECFGKTTQQHYNLDCIVGIVLSQSRTDLSHHLPIQCVEVLGAVHIDKP